MRLQGWFKPRYAIKIDGVSWISDGKMAIVAPESEGLVVPKNVAETLERLIEAATVESYGRVERNGYVLLHGGTVAYQGHFFGLVEAVFPGVVWSVSGGETTAAVARLDGRPVGVVMPLKYFDTIKPMFPACPVCSGSKGRECNTCNGAGEVPCVCDCGHEHDAKCHACNGRGIWGTCDPCNGSGMWTPEMDAAAMPAHE